MKKSTFLLCLLLVSISYAQPADSTSVFWEKVQWGGTGAANFSNQFTSVSISPQAIYPVKSYYYTGVGLHYSYFRRRDVFTSNAYGATWLNFFNPIPEAQLSAELEQLRINNELANGVKDDFWNTALFLGAGYRQQNFIIGIRYNVLFDEANNIYPQAWMPFVRVFF